MIRTLSAVAVTALMLSACDRQMGDETISAPGAPAAQTPTTDVLTAEGYGPLRIGMTRDQVVGAMGDDSDPDAVGGAEPDVCDQWRPVRAPDGLLVMIQNGVLTRISVAAPATLKTDRGFGVGDPAAAIKAAYGAAATTQPHKYSPPPAEDILVWSVGGPAGAAYVDHPTARGVRYEINGQGRVQIVHVGGPAIQLVEGCS